MTELTILEMNALSDRVKHGAIQLDGMIEKWADKIDVDELDLQSFSNCVCGQLVADSYDSEECKKLERMSRDHLLGFMVGWGEFPLLGPRRNEVWDFLQVKWIEEIHQRRADYRDYRG